MTEKEKIGLSRRIILGDFMKTLQDVYEISEQRISQIHIALMRKATRFKRESSDSQVMPRPIPELRRNADFWLALLDEYENSLLIENASSRLSDLTIDQFRTLMEDILSKKRAK